MPTLRATWGQRVQPPAGSCAAFDEQSDIVWVGDSAGSLSGFCGIQLTPYTRFAAHEYAVKRIISHPKGILSTDGHTLRMTNRRGLVVYSVDGNSHPQLAGIKNMALIGTNELLVASQAGLVKFDVIKQQAISTTPYKGDVKLLVSNKRYAALGNIDASIDIYEVKSDAIIARFQLNSTTLGDLDLKEQTLVASGLTMRHGTLCQDSWISVYDIRSQRPLSPVAFPEGAAFVRLHPKLPSVALIGSTKGLVHAVDLFSPEDSSLFTIDAQVMTSLEFSSTGDFLCMLDSMSVLHLCCLDPEHSTMSSRLPIERPDIQDQHTPVRVDDLDFALSEVGMPFYKETLLSAWPPQIVFNSAGTIPKHIDSSLLGSAVVENGFIWAPYDKDKYGSRQRAKPYVSLSKSMDSPRNFLSAKNAASPLKRRVDTPEPEDVFQCKASSTNTIPNAFKKLEILYSRFGIDDFDFDYYNKTRFSGLECHVDNSYTNSLLQLYRFVPEIFNFVIGNLAVENLNPESLLTELGYLYDMLIKADGKHYRPTNFQHTLSNCKEAADMGLLANDNDPSQTKPGELGERLKQFNSFLLKKLAIDEHNASQSHKSTFPQLVGITANSIQSWYYANASKVDQCRSLHLVVHSPGQRSPDTPLRISKPPTIVNCIEASMNKISRVPESHGGFQDIKETNFVVTELPPILSCNISLSSDDKKLMRSTRDWFRSSFFVLPSTQGFVTAEHVPRPDDHKLYKEYEAVGFVCEISGETDYDSHLVTFVQILDDKTGVKNWYLFNDFLVMPIPDSEAFDMSYWWKTPLTVVYRMVTDAPTSFQCDAWRHGLNDDILYRDHFAAGIRESRNIEYKLLTHEEAPKPGSLIAIDAEFVTLEAEKFEIKNNGVRSLLKPKKAALARVSVLRGDDGENLGVPFIDDYVVIQEDIHDYVTSYSGIKHGDLDPNVSEKSLVTRQTVYRKLWLLLNLGCVFVGHGLTMDFRTINICVPKEQVRDTAVFFHKGQRILSLRFLAYTLLQAKVQQGNHDSIEDAHTALMIYKRYQELQASGNFQKTLDQIFQYGQSVKFKPPGED